MKIPSAIDFPAPLALRAFVRATTRNARLERAAGDPAAEDRQRRGEPLPLWKQRAGERADDEASPDETSPRERLEHRHRRRLAS